MAVSLLMLVALFLAQTLHREPKREFAAAFFIVGG